MVSIKLVKIKPCKDNRSFADPCQLLLTNQFMLKTLEYWELKISPDYEFGYILNDLMFRLRPQSSKIPLLMDFSGDFSTVPDLEIMTVNSS